MWPDTVDGCHGDWCNCKEEQVLLTPEVFLQLIIDNEDIIDQL